MNPPSWITVCIGVGTFLLSQFGPAAFAFPVWVSRMGVLAGLLLMSAPFVHAYWVQTNNTMKARHLMFAQLCSMASIIGDASFYQSRLRPKMAPANSKTEIVSRSNSASSEIKAILEEAEKQREWASMGGDSYPLILPKFDSAVTRFFAHNGSSKYSVFLMYRELIGTIQHADGRIVPIDFKFSTPMEILPGAGKEQYVFEDPLGEEVENIEFVFTGDTRNVHFHQSVKISRVDSHWSCTSTLTLNGRRRIPPKMAVKVCTFKPI